MEVKRPLFYRYFDVYLFLRLFLRLGDLGRDTMLGERGRMGVRVAILTVKVLNGQR